MAAYKIGTMYRGRMTTVCYYSIAVSVGMIFYVMNHQSSFGDAFLLRRHDGNDDWAKNQAEPMRDLETNENQSFVEKLGDSEYSDAIENFPEQGAADSPAFTEQDNHESGYDVDEDYGSFLQVLANLQSDNLSDEVENSSSQSHPHGDSLSFEEADSHASESKLGEDNDDNGQSFLDQSDDEMLNEALFEEGLRYPPLDELDATDDQHSLQMPSVEALNKADQSFVDSALEVDS